ncbi:Uma2 family endonuclease [Streptomyces sp. NPDC051940]|uniref:Uma2 family endonuclease n=1 Tax=Streptomyces sp. NPDC051940 TaxID=3155675 RepID=UPI003447B8C4
MTVMAERAPQVTVDEFEQIAKAAEKLADDAVRFEFIDGRIGVKGMPDGDHAEIVAWLQRRCMQSAGLWLYAGGELGLRVEQYRQGRARPDAVLAAEGTFAGQGDWADPDGVLMTVEVTSYDSDTDRRDRQEKPSSYAATGIPYFLLIDRDAGTVTLYSDPGPDGYRDAHSVKFGATLSLPEPIGIELDTERLKDHVR